jgi:hypothetical protein
VSGEDIEAQKQRRAFHAPLVKDRTKNLLDNVKNRLVSATDRLDRIAARIDSRIQKEEAAGSDVSAARSAVERARNELGRAKRGTSMVTELQMDLIVDSESPRIAFQNLFLRIIETKTALTNAKAELGNALNALSNTSTPEPTATSTPPEA